MFRFNNAPHYPAMPTHPHHLHAGTEENILASPVRGGTEVEAVTLNNAQSAPIR